MGAARAGCCAACKAVLVAQAPCHRPPPHPLRCPPTPRAQNFAPSLFTGDNAGLPVVSLWNGGGIRANIPAGVGE